MKKALQIFKNCKQTIFIFNMISYCKHHSLIYPVMSTVTSEFIFNKHFMARCWEFYQESANINNWNSAAAAEEVLESDNNKDWKMKNNNTDHDNFKSKDNSESEKIIFDRTENNNIILIQDNQKICCSELIISLQHTIKLFWC